MAGLGEDQHRGRHPCIGLEYAGRHGDHGLQPVAVHKLLTDGFVCGGGAEQHAVRDNAGAASADAQHPQEQRQKQQLGFLGLADLEKIRRHGVCVQTALEGRVGQNQGILLLVRVLVAKAVPILDKGVVDAVGHHVHGTDAEHGTVHVIAKEHVVHIVILLLAVEENFFFTMLLQVFACRNKEAGGAAGRVADHVVGFRVHQLHHHADNVARGTELTVEAGLADFAQQIFIGIAPHIHRLRFVHQAINLVQRIHHFG